MLTDLRFALKKLKGTVFSLMKNHCVEKCNRKTVKARPEKLKEKKTTTKKKPHAHFTGEWSFVKFSAYKNIHILQIISCNSYFLNHFSFKSLTILVTPSNLLTILRVIEKTKKTRQYLEHKEITRLLINNFILFRAGY